METNMLIGLLIGSIVVALLGYLAYRVKCSFDKIDKQVSEAIDDTFRSIDELERTTNLGTSEVYQEINELNKNLDLRIDELHRILDSRLDKQEARLKKELLQ